MEKNEKMQTQTNAVRPTAPAPVARYGYVGSVGSNGTRSHNPAPSAVCGNVLRAS